MNHNASCSQLWPDTLMAGLNQICTFLRQLVTISAHYSFNCTQRNGRLYSLSSTNFLKLFSKTQSINTSVVSPTIMFLYKKQLAQNIFTPIKQDVEY